MSPSKPATKAPRAATCPEVELLLCCARTCIDPETAERIRTLLQQHIDWTYLIQTAFHHGIMPLLYQSLNTTCPEIVPKAILEELRNYFLANAAHNLFLTKELLKLLNLFKDHNIPVIPYKGPTLAVSVYRNLTLRQFGDLDVLVHKRDYLKAQEMLISKGYDPPPQQEVDWERKFVNRNSWIEVDLHQKITPWYLPFPINFEDLWKQLEPVSLTGSTVLSFSPEDLLIVLCVQIAKDSQWKAEVLSKICDIAELIERHPTLDLQRVWQKCVKLGSKRMLLFGLLLAQQLRGTVLPETILLKMQADQIAQLACVQVCEELFDNSRVGGERVFLRKLGRERWQDKVRHFLRVAITPNEKDWEFLPLPNFLSFLYYFTRPFRLFGKYGMILLKRILQICTSTGERYYL